MASLTADQARYVDLVAAGIPLDRNVVVAWVACESGWGVDKANHNYLNIGPGRSYPSTDAAAADAVAVAHQSNMHIGGATPQAQLQSIVSSPWDAGHYAGGCLLDTYNGLGAGTVTLAGSGSNCDALMAKAQSGTKLSAAEQQQLAQCIADGSGGAITNNLDPFGWVSDLVNGIGQVLFTTALGFVFTATALGIIVLGVSRLTGKNVSDRARQTASTAVSAAAIAAA